MFERKEQEGLKFILRQELEYFKTIYQFSEKFANQIQTMSVNVLAEMLNYRQELLDKVKDLETQRKAFSEEQEPDEVRNLFEKISEVAGNLVELDNTIYENLQSKKMEYIRQLSDTASGMNYQDKLRNQDSGQGRMIDTRLE